MVKLYADFETGLIGVGKTADLSGAELESLGKDIDELSKRMPVATDKLLAIAQSAGQLGVKGSDNILKFTETVAKLGTATDLSGDQAAMALARILNVTGEALGTVDVLGSVIVALGNNFAATESQIAEMATEVARGAAVFGVSSAQASALAAALAAVGVKSEVAGTSIGRILRMIDAAIRSGGEHLAILTQITGRTAEEIEELFQRDAMAAFALFIDGLKRIGDAGGSVADAKAALGLFDGASRYHRGGIVGGERPIVVRDGEGVFTPGQMRNLAPVSEAKPVVNVAVNVRNTAPGTWASADVRREPGGDLTLDIMIEQIEGGMARHIGRGEGLAPTLERRYGLNPAAGSLR